MSRSEAQIAGDRKRCLNGVCAMTLEERRERKKLYMKRIMEDPFRHEKYLEYFRKRHARIREKANAQARERYHRDIEASRAYEREKYHRYVKDPEKAKKRHAATHARRYGPDGKPTERFQIELIRYRLIPRWRQVVADGREEQYMRRTTDRNRRLFNMWLRNRPLFDEMMKSAGKKCCVSRQ